MKPEVDQILGLSAGQLTGTIAPLLPTVFAQGSASLLGFMMMFAAQEYDRAADIRVAENGDLRALFREAAPLVGDHDLKIALSRAAETRDDSLKVSMLDTANVELRRVLIRLQVLGCAQGFRRASSAAPRVNPLRRRGPFCVNSRSHEKAVTV